MSLRAPRRIATCLAVPTALAAAVILVPPTAQGAPAKHEEKYKGSALAVSAKVGLAGQTLLDEILPSLVTFPEGGVDTLLEVPVEGVVDLKVVNASSGLEDDTLVSNASVAALDVAAGLVTADVLTADCTAKDLNVEGDSLVAGLALAGMKIPVDAGPNFEVEIPDALSALIKGGITIDEQTESEDGELRVRALHINLVVAPDAIPAALASVSEAVRAAAETIKGAVEAATGMSLEELLGQTEAEPDAKPEAGKAERATAPKVGAQAAERQQLRADAAAPQAPAAATATEESTTATETSDAAAPAASSGKSDDAAIDREAAAAQDDAQSDTEATDENTGKALDARAEQAAAEADAAQPDTTQADTTQADAAAQAQATRAEATDAALAAEQAKAAEQAQQREAAREASTSKNKADGAALAAPDRAAAPAIDDSIVGALGIDVVISQVTCKGAEAPVVVAEEPKEKPELPKAGGNGVLSRDLAVAGLGLLAVGSAAVFVTRRRGLHVRP